MEIKPIVPRRSKLARHLNWVTSFLAPDIRNLMFLGDLAAYGLLKHKIIPENEHDRAVRSRQGFSINYTRNRCDLFTIQEVFGRQLYRLPVDVSPSVIVDLGANIGCATVYFWSRYHPSVMICVEPQARNIRLLKKNLLGNGIPAIVLEGVVAEASGTKTFQMGNAAGGHIGDGGIPLKAFSIDDILARTPNHYADLIKMDIEGYEDVLLRENNDWLNRVGCIVMEIHGEYAGRPLDKRSLIGLLQAKGFNYIDPVVSYVEHTFVRAPR